MVRQNKLHLLVAAAMLASSILTGCGGSDDDSGASAATTKKAAPQGTTDAPVKERVKPKVVVPPGAPPKELLVTDLRKGTGSIAQAGRLLTVQFAALRWNGKPFQSSWDNGKFQPFTFKLGENPPQVIPGWEQGLPGMRVGGRRQLIVPPKYIYNREMLSEYLEPRDSLIYVVELLKVDQ